MTLTNKVKALWRLRRIKSDMPAIFNNAVYHCAKVSALNHTLSFIVHKVGVFGGPMVEQIPRPETIQISESDIDQYIIIRDGFIYKLTKEIC